MSATTLNSRIILCSKTSASWASETTVALKGEMLVELTSGTPKIKIGDGITTFSQLPYVTMTPEETQAAIQTAITNLNAMPKSGGTFTGEVVLAADPIADLEAATKKYVDDQITERMGASDAMVFKGTLGTGGTVTALPTTGVTTGDTYKVITAGTYAGHACRVGDMLIALNTGSVAATSANWAYIPSGDETETLVNYSTSTTNVTTTPQSGTITLAEGAVKQVDSSISAGSTSGKLPTTQAVASFVESKTYSITGKGTAAPTSFNGTGSLSLNMTAFDASGLTQTSGDVLILDGNFGGTSS